ncbi:agmatinase [Suttonella ornithocola]|uniref:Agmatinase n=1 Tax=Suttonella ornithocola TaxID=279832 RepID=A0A380ML03_9GAMM|nr:agmatinase [Suttonella ornithocola]SUO93329.1 Agmatinase [Suttonella ornithocola]
MQASGIFLGSEIRQGDKERARFHVIPVPFEKSVSYGGGTAKGPQAIIEASDQLETYDQIQGEPCQFGIYTHQAVDCRGEAADVMQRIREATKAVAEKGNIPFVLGGEHTVSYGAVMGVVDAYPNERIGVVQFDAHADLRESYEGSIWSHASVMKRLVDENLPLFQIGVRAISMEECAVRDEFPAQIHYLDAKTICAENPQFRFALPADFPKKIYLTVDIDGLDGAIMPATGTPVPGGLSFWQLIALLQSAVEGREVVGMDLVEYAPISGLHVYDYTAADLAYKMMSVASNWADEQQD